MLDGFNCSFGATGSVFSCKGTRRFLAAHSRVLLEILAFSLHLDATLRPWLGTLAPLLPHIEFRGFFNGSPTLARITDQWTQQSEMGIRPAMEPRHPAPTCRLGFFADGLPTRALTAFIYSNTPPMLDQLPDTLWSQGSALNRAGCRTDGGHESQSVPEWATVGCGQLERPYPQYNGLSLAGYGCCEAATTRCKLV